MGKQTDGPFATRIYDLRECAGHHLKGIREQLDSQLCKLHLRHNEQGCQLYRAMVKTNLSEQFPLYFSWILYFTLDDRESLGHRVGLIDDESLNCPLYIKPAYEDFLRSILMYTNDEMKSKLKAEIQYWVELSD